MDAKQIASELLDKFRSHSYNGASEEDDERMKYYHAKQNVLITLDVVKSFC